MSNESPDRQQQRPSRFAYHGTEPAEGGVHSAAPKSRSSNGGSGGGAHLNAGPRQASNGVPGPEERLLDISEITRNVGMRYTHRFRIPPVSGAEEGLSLAGPMEGQLTFTNTGAALLLEGYVSAPLTVECSRCLSPTVETVESDIGEQFDLVTSSNAFHQEVVTAVDEDQPASVIENGTVLNLGELLRQSLLLAAPLQPLCRAECPGIDLAGHQGVGYSTEDQEGAAEPADVRADNPLRHLAEMMAAKRSAEENTNGTDV